MKRQSNKKKQIIRTEGLAHEYSRRDEAGNVLNIIRAIDGVSISVSPGDFVAVLGANGSGKSTFAKHLNGLLFPTEGTVYVDGIDTTQKEHILTVRQTAGMVFQNPDNQIISNVVEEDVGFGPENLGVPTGKILERVKLALKSVRMYGYRKHSPNHLSGGQKQRVAIAGIMAMRPKCIILDEATSMLDPEGRKEILEVIHSLNRDEGITVILITHYMEEVTSADYVYVMNQGKVALSGTPREVFVQTDKLKQCRLTIPRVTQIAQTLHQKGLPVPKNILTEEELLSCLEQLREGGK